MTWRDVPVPDLMRYLPRDTRGYPIPVMVQRDSQGKPHFTVNDENLRRQCIKEDLCSICGNKLLRGRWFIGGPLSAFHPNGSYLDPPLHKECAHYALQVCPWLAVQRYNSRIEAGTMSAEEQVKAMVTIDYTMIPGHPPVFVAVMATKQKTSMQGGQLYLKPRRPYAQVEYWRNGVQLPGQEGAAIVHAALAESLPELQGPKVRLKAL